MKLVYLTPDISSLEAHFYHQNCCAKKAKGAGLAFRSIAIANIIASRYYRAVIKSFANRNTQKLFNGEAVPRLPPEIRERARLRLAQLNVASTLEFMMIPPSNRLEALKGDRKGQHSVRINQQWRICFRWSDGNAFDVEITDYH